MAHGGTRARPPGGGLLGAPLPLFDAHIHYSQPAWSILTPEQALERLARSGVRRAIHTDARGIDGVMRGPAAWRALLTACPDRFLAGSDAWVNSQWERLPEIEAAQQSWLRQLPADVARRIASRKGEVLFPRAR